MSRRSVRVAEIANRLGDRNLYWGGLRSDDVEALADVPQLAGSFSIIGGHGRPTGVQSTDLERSWGSRVDLDAWDIDDCAGHAAVCEFRDHMLVQLLRPSALMVYRPNRFLSSIAFSRRDRCRYLGLFHEHQRAFDHKPWVETSLGDEGLRRVPWTYVATGERHRVERMMEAGPVMLRPSRGSGGTGLALTRDPSDVVRSWPRQPDEFASVSPYLEGSVPLNVGGTTWADGSVTLAHPSLQLIGIPSCTDKAFGYCGNDFGAARELDGRILDDVEESTMMVGRWLAQRGYVGSFGVDFLVQDGVPLFAELNPRFQGSTHASCRLSIEAGEPCLMVDHLAAHLRLEPPPPEPLRHLARRMPDLCSIVVHALDSGRPGGLAALVDRLKAVRGYVRTDVIAHPDLVAERGSTLLRVTSRSRCTTTGMALLEPWSSIIADWAGKER